MANYEEALAEAKELISLLDSLAEEDWIAESFVAELLTVEHAPGSYSVDLGAVLYGLREMGNPQLALDFEIALDSKPRPTDGDD